MRIRVVLIKQDDKIIARYNKYLNVYKIGM